MKQSEHKIWNERMAVLYDPDAFITKTFFLIRWMEMLRLNETKKALGRVDGRVLDLGCGAGNLLQKLEGNVVVGCDLSEQLIQLSHGRVRGQKNFLVVRAEAESLPFPDNFFDHVVCSELLEHVLDPGQVMKEIYRVSKPQAQIIVTVPNERLINFSKKAILFLRLKKWVAGQYRMSDNMLHQWHKSEVLPGKLINDWKAFFRLKALRGIPAFFFPYHKMIQFETIKPND